MKSTPICLALAARVLLAIQWARRAARAGRESVGGKGKPNG